MVFNFSSDKKALLSSEFCHQRWLINIRHEIRIQVGNTGTVVSGNVLALGRFQDDIHAIFIAFVNFGDQPETINVSGQFSSILNIGLILIDTLGNLG